MRKFLSILKNTIVLFLVASMLTTLIYRFIPIPLTPLMLLRSIEAIGNKTVPKIDYRWQDNTNITAYFTKAAVAAEDQKFYDHIGFDIEAIKKAIKHNKNYPNKSIKGGSTISQQCAKNVFLWHGRNWIRKGLEVYFTLLIELFWSKERILEVYLNVIEMGQGVYGAEAAAQYYFGKHAKALTKEEVATIVAIFPNPRKWNVKNPNWYVSKRKNWILKQMRNLE